LEAFSGADNVGVETPHHLIHFFGDWSDSMSKTYRANFSAAVKTYPDGQPFIVFETYNRHLPPFDTFIGLSVRPGITLAEVNALVDQLNDCVATVGLTPLPEDAA
jgi:hypothetical protein